MKFYSTKELNETFEVAEYADMNAIYHGKKEVTCKATGEKFTAIQGSDGEWFLQSL